MQGIQIIGTGRALPDKVVTNEELCKLVDSSDEWIRSRTGISQRYVCAGETCVSLATEAAKKAIDCRNIDIDDIKINTIDTYSQEEMMDVLAYESEELEYRNHKIKIEVLGEKREAAHEPKIAIYRFEVDEEKNNNLDLTELKAIVAELKTLINE